MNRLLQILNKIKIYLEYHGLRETLHWLYSRVTAKLKKKLGKQGISAATPEAYAKAEAAYRAAGKAPVQWPDYRAYLPTGDEAAAAPKTGKQVFLFANIPYYDIGGGQRSSQLAKTFNKMGFAVHYIYGFGSSDFDHKNTLVIPCVSHLHIDALDLADFRSMVRPDDLLVLEGPVGSYIPYVDAAKAIGAKVVYENIDNWETSLGSGVYSAREDLNHILRQSDLLVGTARLLADQLAGYCRELGITKPIAYLANAVDDELFAPLLQYDLPKDMVSGSKTLLYYGSLWGEWFDWDLVFGIAKADPTISVNLIGDFDNILHICKKAPANVHFPGLKKQTELPAYLSYTDFALIPFKTGEIGDYVSPLKMFEYIAMGKNVLTTPLPDVAGYPNVYASNHLSDWLSAIHTAPLPDAAAADAFTAGNTWVSRIQSMLDLVYPTEADRCGGDFYGNVSVVILNYNNKHIIDKSVASLLRNNARYNCEIIVVDNCSTDGSPEQLQERFGEAIKLVRNTKNGCSSGRNLGAAAASGKYILFLDSDQWVTGKYWLDPFIDVCTAAGTSFGAVGWAGGWFNRFGSAFHIVDDFAHRSMPPTGLYRSDVGYLGTGGFLMEKALFDSFGGFDEAYDPTCYEDTDLSLQVRHAGKQLYYCPHLGVVHLPHQTTKDGSEAHTRLIYEKQRYFTDKWTKLHPELLQYIKED